MSLPSDLPTAERLALYEKAVNATVPELREMLAENARRAATPAERFALEAAFVRYTELDTRAAAMLADELGLEPALAAQAYAAWATMDPASALRALGRISDEARARAIAQTVAPILARRDPRSTLEAARHIDRAGLEMLFESVAVEHWAASAPEEMVEWFASLPSARLEALLSAPRDFVRLETGDVAPRIDVIGALARANPTRLLEIADRLSVPLAATVRRMGIAELAEQDPAAAIAHVEHAAMDPVQRRQELGSIAPAYARRDPAAALAWARASGDAELLAQVLTAVAAVDPLLALDAALGETAPAERARLLQSVSASFWNADATRLAAVAERLLVEPSVEPYVVASLVGRWSSVDPIAAVDWLVAQGERAGVDAFRVAAAYAAQHDVDAAAAYTFRIPDAARPAWLSQVATAYAARDPMGAARWIEQFRGLRGYEEAIAAAAPSLAAQNPAAAAELLSRVDASSPFLLGAVMSVAASWTAQDPAAAAAWAAGLADAARQSALPSVVSMWAQQAPQDARGFVMSLPRGEDRDRILHSLIATTSRTGTDVDPALLNAFSSDVARQHAVIQAAVLKASDDPAAARALVNAHVTDPRLRTQAEEMLTRVPEMLPRVAPLGTNTVALSAAGGAVLSDGTSARPFPSPRFLFAPPAVEGARVVTPGPVVVGPAVTGTFVPPPGVTPLNPPSRPDTPAER